MKLVDSHPSQHFSLINTIFAANYMLEPVRKYPWFPTTLLKRRSLEATAGGRRRPTRSLFSVTGRDWRLCDSERHQREREAGGEYCSVGEAQRVGRRLGNVRVSGKFIEKIINLRLRCHVKENIFYNPSHHGSRAGRSTTPPISIANGKVALTKWQWKNCIITQRDISKTIDKV